MVEAEVSLVASVVAAVLGGSLIGWSLRELVRKKER